MSAESRSAEQPVCTSPPAEEAAGANALAESVVPGQVWRGKYRVDQALADFPGRWFAAEQVGSGEKVWLRVSREAADSCRSRWWPAFSRLDSPLLQKPVEVFSGAERVEVWQAPGAPTLRRWRTDHPEAAKQSVRSLVRQLAAALELLHAAGLGHFGLRADAIFVRAGADGPEFVLGGFESVAEFQQNELIPVAVDVLGAPPEAAGLYQHSPGPLLLAWDWWSLGRIAQDLILGHHVLMLLPDELYLHPPRSRSRMAEDLLFERDIGALRAGAVELMTGLDADLGHLLRGLLASAREGRWGAAEVREWLAGAPPVERYDAPRQQRFFRLDGRGYTPPEAAKVLLGPDHWDGMKAHVFGTGEPGRLAEFLHATRAKHHYYEMLEQATKLTQATGLKGVSPELVREIASALALTAISGGEFHWRGRPLVSSLGDLVRQEAEIDENCTTLGALASPAVLELLQQYDSATAEHLEDLVKGAVEAESLLSQCGLVRVQPRPERVALWLCALEPAAQLGHEVVQLHGSFACSTNPALEKLFSHPHPTRGMMVLLAWSGRDAVRHGYLTHAQVKAQKLAALVEQGRLVAQVVFWQRLSSALRAGPLLFGNLWLLLAAGFGLCLLVAVHLPGAGGLGVGLAPLGGLALVRLGVNRWQAHLVASWTKAARWTRRDGVARAQREARSLADALGQPCAPAAAPERLRCIQVELAALAAPDPGPVLSWPPRQGLTWMAAVASWLALLVILTGSGWWAVKHPPTWLAHATAWHRPVREAAAEPPADQKVSWPYRLQRNSPFPPLEVRSDGAFAPTEEQKKTALQRAQALTAPYKPETIDGLLAVYVPLEGTRGALLLYDGKRGALAGRAGVRIGFVPLPKIWLKVGDEYAIFIAP